MTRRTRTTLLLGCLGLALLFAPPADRPGTAAGEAPGVARAAAGSRAGHERAEHRGRAVLGALVPGSTQAVSAVLRPGPGAGGR